MASSSPLATAAALAARTGRPASDLNLKAQLVAASSRFRAAVHHNVSLVEDDVIYLDGTGSKTILLPPPLVSITSLIYDDGSPDGVAYVQGTDFRISRRTGILERVNGVWPRMLEFAKLTYTHGYDAEAKDPADPTRLRYVPDEIQDAVLDMAETLLVVEKGVQQRTVLGDSIQFGAASSVGTTQSWTDVVNNYAFGQGDRA